MFNAAESAQYRLCVQFVPYLREGMIRSLILPGLSQGIAAEVGLYDVLDRHIVVPGEAGGDVRAFDTFEQLGGGQASGLPAPDATPPPFTSPAMHSIDEPEPIVVEDCAHYEEADTSMVAPLVTGPGRLHSTLCRNLSGIDG